MLTLLINHNSAQLKDSMIMKRCTFLCGIEPVVVANNQSLRTIYCDSNNHMGRAWDSAPSLHPHKHKLFSATHPATQPPGHLNYDWYISATDGQIFPKFKLRLMWLKQMKTNSNIRRKVKKPPMEEDLQWKTTTIIKSEKSQQLLVGLSSI